MKDDSVIIAPESMKKKLLKELQGILILMKMLKVSCDIALILISYRKNW